MSRLPPSSLSFGPTVPSFKSNYNLTKTTSPPTASKSLLPPSNFRPWERSSTPSFMSQRPALISPPPTTSVILLDDSDKENIPPTPPITNKPLSPRKLDMFGWLGAGAGEGSSMALLHALHPNQVTLPPINPNPIISSSAIKPLRPSLKQPTASTSSSPIPPSLPTPTTKSRSTKRITTPQPASTTTIDGASPVQTKPRAKSRTKQAVSPAASSVASSHATATKPERKRKTPSSVDSKSSRKKRDPTNKEKKSSKRAKLSHGQTNDSSHQHHHLTTGGDDDVDDGDWLNDWADELDKELSSDGTETDPSQFSSPSSSQEVNSPVPCSIQESMHETDGSEVEEEEEEEVEEVLMSSNDFGLPSASPFQLDPSPLPPAHEFMSTEDNSLRRHHSASYQDTDSHLMALFHSPGFDDAILPHTDMHQQQQPVHQMEDSHFAQTATSFTHSNHLYGSDHYDNPQNPTHHDSLDTQLQHDWFRSSTPIMNEHSTATAIVSTSLPPAFTTAGPISSVTATAAASTELTSTAFELDVTIDYHLHVTCGGDIRRFLQTNKKDVTTDELESM